MSANTDITEADEKRSPEAEETLNPQEDLSHGDEGVDDPQLEPEDATKVTTNFDGEPTKVPEEDDK